MPAGLIRGRRQMTEEARSPMRDGSPTVQFQSPTSTQAERVTGGSYPLPQPRTPLIGRKHAVEAVRDLLLRDDVPLVTLTGPGGVGKTRLALQVAAEVAPAFADGVRLIELSGLRDPQLVLPAIVTALGVADAGTRPVFEQLMAYLHRRGMLLLLDNVEPVVEAAPQIAALLTRCPDLKVLATSRVLLRLSFEHDIPVPPLAGAEAVQLFVARARAARPGFALTADNAADVAAICTRLDGLPLAIELAAARTPTLPPAAMLTRLDQILPLLIGGARDLPERQRTMRAAITWSYDLLSPIEQTLFARLAIFAGGFELRAAEAVCKILSGHEETGPRFRLPPPTTMLDVVQSLRQSSLLQAIDGPATEEPRYRMLETLREFALDCLETSNEAQAVRAAHARCVLELVERVSVQTFAPAFGQSLERLRFDQENVRAALEWAAETGADEVGLRLARAMSDYWMVRGQLREGRHWLEHFLTRTSPVPSVTRAGALTSIGWVTCLQGDLTAAEVYLSQAVDVARIMADGWLEAVARLGLALVLLQRGDFAHAAEHSEDALQRFAAVEQTAAAGPQWTSIAFANRGQIAVCQGDAATANAYLEDALARQQVLKFNWGAADSLRILGDLARDQTDYHRALPYYHEAVELWQSHGDLRLLTEALTGLASVAACCGQADRAVRLYAAAAAHRGVLGAPVAGWDRAAHERGLASARAGLSPEAFEEAWAAGEELPLASAIAEALAVRVPADDRHLRTDDQFRLTKREHEILTLLSAGLSDREIAERLSISPRTAGFHVSNLLGKLGVDSRTAAVAAALRHDLV
jgi:predicted ATPase/DNA-binding CsgD family transcriptional regulator